jgi:hypothetical protein
VLPTAAEHRARALVTAGKCPSKSLDGQRCFVEVVDIDKFLHLVNPYRAQETLYVRHNIGAERSSSSSATVGKRILSLGAAFCGDTFNTKRCTTVYLGLPELSQLHLRCSLLRCSQKALPRPLEAIPLGLRKSTVGTV